MQKYKRKKGFPIPNYRYIISNITKQSITHRFFLFMVFCLIVITGNAQTKLTGKVFNKNTSKTLVGVNIYIPELKRGTASNHDGVYTINVPYKRKVKVQFSHIGYKTELKTILTDTLLSLFNIALEPVVLESEEIVISGMSPSTQHENVTKIETVKIEEIESFGSPNLIEALSSIPGVNMISKSPGVSLPVIRGLSMTNIIVMNNGVKLENYQYSKNHAFIIDEFGIEQIEIIKGPASLLYGSGAVGGVINFVKEKPALTDGIVGDYTGHYHSNTLGFCNSLGVKGRKKDFFWGLRAGYKNHADYLDGNGDYVPNTRFNDKSLKANLGLIKPFGSFKLYYDYNQPQLGMCMQPVTPLIKERGRVLKWWYQDLESHVISSRNKIFMGNYKFDVNLAYQSNKRKGWTDTTTLGYKLVDATMSTFSYELKTHLPSNNKSEYILGIQGEKRNNRNHNAPVDVIPDADINDFSVFGLVQFDLWERLKTQGGIRYDYCHLSTSTRKKNQEINRSYNNLSSSIGATYSINSTLMVRLNFASAYRTPNVGELTQDGWHGVRYEQGNPDLKAQRNIETDLSLHYHSENLMIDISAFYNHVKNYIYMSPTNDTISSGECIYRHSQSNAKLFGGELSCAYAPVNWIKLQATYSYLHAEKEDGNYLPFISPEQLSTSVKIKKEQLLFLHDTYLKVGIDIEGKQKKPSLFETETNGFMLVNMGLGAKIEFGKQQIDLGVFINNLFNKTYYNHLSTLKELGYYNMGRNISFLIKVPFKI